MEVGFTVLVTGGVRQARLGSPNKQNTAETPNKPFRPGNGTKHRNKQKLMLPGTGGSTLDTQDKIGLAGPQTTFSKYTKH